MTTPLRVDYVDISHWQSGSLDFRAAERAGCLAVIHKATQGTRYVDDRYAARRKQVIGPTDMRWGGYHYLEHGNAAAQAKHFMRTANLGPGDIIPVCDYEEKSLTDDDWRGFKETCLELGAPEVWLYTYPAVAPGVSLNSPLWLARYHNANIPPEIPEGWTNEAWVGRQFSNGVYGVPKSCPGLGNVDLNTLPKGIESLKRVVWPVENHPTRVQQAKDLLEEAQEIAERKGKEARVEKIGNALDDLPGKKD